MKSIFIKSLSIMMLVLLVASIATAALPAFAAGAPTSVSLDQTGTVSLAVGEKLTLTPTLNPVDATTTFSWKSSKKNIASVSGGVVTAKKVGTTTITVTTSNKKTAKVKVKVVDPYKPSKVTLNVSGTQTLLVSNALQLVATLDPITSQSTLKWKSSNKKVAIVDQNGLVGALAPGKTTITVTTRNKKKAKVKIKVIDDGNQPIVPPAGYNLPYVIYACKNTHTIAVLAQDSNGAWTRVIRLFPTGMGRKNVTDVGFYYLSKKERWHKWGSGYSPYANRLSVGIYLHGPIYKQKNHHTIRPEYYNGIGKDCSSGCLRTTCACASFIYYNCPVGTMVIIAQNSRFSTPRPAKIGKKATTDPTDPGTNYDILVTGFNTDPVNITLEQGATRAITVSGVTPSNTSTKGFTYSSNDKSIATVSDSGVVTAVAPGSTTISVVANDDFKFGVQIPVTVVAKTASSAEMLVAAEAAQIPEEASDFEALESAGYEIPAGENAVMAIDESAEETAANADEANAGETVTEVNFPADSGNADAAGDTEEDAAVTGSEENPSDQLAIPTEGDDGLIADPEIVPEERTEIIIDQE